MMEDPVGASLLAMVCQSPRWQLILHRKQARSYRGAGSDAELIHQALLLIRQAIERLAHPRRLVGLT